jgi:O-antigen/teichoic acid export membrane protein
MPAETKTHEPPRTNQLLKSGIIFSAASILVALGNFAFQMIIRRRLEDGPFGMTNTTLGFAQLLGLPMGCATIAVTHYVARFHFSGDDARLRGLFAGCRKFLFHLTLISSVLAVLLLKPLSDFFHFPPGLMLAALCCVLMGFWSAFATALCQGLGWFKRLAFIGILAVCLRLAFGGLVTIENPTAETAVLASAFMLLAYLALLFWRKDMSRKAEPVSPWNAEFVHYLIVAAAFSGGTYFFTQGDLLVVQRIQPAFHPGELGAYVAAGIFARNLPTAVGPMLTVLFTHRSSQHQGSALREQLRLLGLYAVGLGCGVAILLSTRIICLKILGKYTPEAAEMLVPLSITMAFAGLLQALAMWALASRWLKISLLYGALGLVYWLALLFLGKSPANLLRVMPVAAGIVFVIIFLVWIAAMRPRKTAAPAQS